MANFDELAMLFAINNVEVHQNNFNNAHHERQTRNKEIITDPFKLTDWLFIEIYKGICSSHQTTGKINVF